MSGRDDAHDAERLIRRLALTPHPEGGAFRERFRSPRRVRLPGESADRSALTTIYFLLRAGEKSRWHRVTHDEVWHFYEGDPLDLWILSADLASAARHVLSQPSASGEPVAVVPAGSWQAARTTGSHTLVGCTVAPGFEYDDWSLLADEAEQAAALAQRHPDLADLL